VSDAAHELCAKAAHELCACVRLFVENYSDLTAEARLRTIVTLRPAMAAEPVETVRACCCDLTMLTCSNTRSERTARACRQVHSLPKVTAGDLSQPWHQHQQQGSDPALHALLGDARRARGFQRLQSLLFYQHSDCQQQRL
jgi:hypothetical protein